MRLLNIHIDWVNTLSVPIDTLNNGISTHLAMIAYRNTEYEIYNSVSVVLQEIIDETT